MISFIIPFSCVEENVSYNLPSWTPTRKDKAVLTTIEVIRNINKVVEQDHEIILVDNSNNFPKVNIPNLKIIKGLQTLNIKELKESQFADLIDFKNIDNQSMWAGMAYNQGIEEASGEYIVLQHNDVFYFDNLFPQLIDDLKYYRYINADNKKLSLEGYLVNRHLLEGIVDKPTFKPNAGIFVETDFGFSDAYFFIARKNFFKTYTVDWALGDTNHGATLKCIREEAPYLHLGPFYDNPNTMLKEEQGIRSRIYEYKGKDFIMHLKGGFSEHKFTKNEWLSEWNNFMNLLYNVLRYK